MQISLHRRHSGALLFMQINASQKISSSPHQIWINTKHTRQEMVKEKRCEKVLSQKSVKNLPPILRCTITSVGCGAFRGTISNLHKINPNAILHQTSHKLTRSSTKKLSRTILITFPQSPTTSRNYFLLLAEFAINHCLFMHTQQWSACSCTALPGEQNYRSPVASLTLPGNCD